MGLSSPEIPIGLARRISLARMRDAQRERGVGGLTGRIRNEGLGHITPVDQNETRH